MHLEGITTDDTRATQPSPTGIVRAPLPVHPHVGTGDQLDLLYAAKLTVPQSAQKLGIGETQMRAIIRNGDIPVVRILGKTLLLERDLEAFLLGHYGSLRKAERQTSRMPSLPKHIWESNLLKKTG